MIFERKKKTHGQHAYFQIYDRSEEAEIPCLCTRSIFSEESPFLLLLG